MKTKRIPLGAFLALIASAAAYAATPTKTPDALRLLDQPQIAAPLNADTNNAGQNMGALKAEKQNTGVAIGLAKEAKKQKPGGLDKGAVFANSMIKLTADPAIRYSLSKNRTVGMGGEGLGDKRMDMAAQQGTVVALNQKRNSGLPGGSPLA